MTEATADGPKYPDVKVELIGHDGNAFAIIGHVTRAMRKVGVHGAEIDLYIAEATAGDYDHLLATTTRWVEVI